MLLELLIRFFPSRIILWLLSIVIAPLQKAVLNSISHQVKIKEIESHLETAYAHPLVSFRVLLDSKAPIKLRTERVVVSINLEGIPFDKFIWSREDKGIHEEFLGAVDDVPALESGNIVFKYALPIYSYFNIARIYLRGYIRFRCLFGAFNLLIKIKEPIKIKDDEKDKAIRKIKEYYKDFF
ncbi:MAG: hypothetical protein QMC78_04650 [Methanocellales archaeon]|nr:hypothetical protein [Methanocellales archaeon]